MMQVRRCFAVIRRDDGRFSIREFFSVAERKKYCSIEENNASPITWKEWLLIPHDMKA